MMVTDLFIVNYLFCMDRNMSGISELPYQLVHQMGEHSFHVFRQKPAVRSGICHQLFFIKALGVIQSLLCRKSQEPVGISLQCSQAIKLWCLFLFVCCLQLRYQCRLFFFETIKYFLRILPVFKPIGSCHNAGTLN